ncbi:MAG: hypothetical protein ACYTBJ_06260 [Planctomycetota bacterium]
MGRTRFIDHLIREAKHALWRASLASNTLDEMIHRQKANEFIREAREECLKRGIEPLFLTEFDLE